MFLLKYYYMLFISLLIKVIFLDKTAENFLTFILQLVISQVRIFQSVMNFRRYKIFTRLTLRDSFLEGIHQVFNFIKR